MSTSVYSHTPSLMVIDSRGLAVRQVNFYRSVADSQPAARVHAEHHDLCGRAAAASGSITPSNTVTTLPATCCNSGTKAPVHSLATCRWTRRATERARVRTTSRRTSAKRSTGVATNSSWRLGNPCYGVRRIVCRRSTLLPAPTLKMTPSVMPTTAAANDCVKPPWPCHGPTRISGRALHAGPGVT
jgi:hypothetical protein